jgi:hypothetical protein
MERINFLSHFSFFVELYTRNITNSIVSTGALGWDGQFVTVLFANYISPPADEVVWT